MRKWYSFVYKASAIDLLLAHYTQKNHGAPRQYKREREREREKTFVQIKHFDGPTCLILFNMDNAIATVANMNETTVLQLSTVTGNGFIHGSFFSLLDFKSFLYELNRFHSFFMLINLTIVFCYLKVDLQILWHALIYLGSTSTSVLDKTDITVLSKLLSDKFSGIPLKGVFLHLPDKAKSFWIDSSVAPIFQDSQISP